MPVEGRGGDRDAVAGADAPRVDPPWRGAPRGSSTGRRTPSRPRVRRRRSSRTSTRVAGSPRSGRRSSRSAISSLESPWTTSFRRSASPASSAPRDTSWAVRTIGAFGSSARAASALPAGPRNHRLRIPSSTIRFAITAACRRRYESIPARSSSVPAAVIAAAKGMRMSRSRSSCCASCRAEIADRAASTARSVSPRDSATEASAASAFAPHGAWPGNRGRSSLALDADRSASDRSSSSSRAAPREAAASASDASASHRAAGSPWSAAIWTARSRCARIPSASPRAASRSPRQSSSWRPRDGVGLSSATVAARSSHVAASSTSPSSTFDIAVPPAERNSSCRSPIARARS